MVLLLTNCGQAATVVKGYPDLALQDDHAEPLAVRVTHDKPGTFPDLRVVAVPLRPGARAQAYLTWRGTVELEGSVLQTEGLLVRPRPVGGPRAAAQLLPLTVDLGTTRTVDVTAWQPAGTG